eukprot:TRINITY_DN42724_c0_g1_i1.p1 TRINITY_DN42724_c0_g1~~TRINITY_DN42724_c0_g1_i1.p1  ORF type:complete len:1366 (-),score=311.43 TRINITY_DN42724_c0_g1_i1:117-4214(-)
MGSARAVATRATRVLVKQLQLEAPQAGGRRSGHAVGSLQRSGGRPLCPVQAQPAGAWLGCTGRSGSSSSSSSGLLDAASWRCRPFTSAAGPPPPLPPPPPAALPPPPPSSTSHSPSHSKNVSTSSSSSPQPRTRSAPSSGERRRVAFEEHCSSESLERGLGDGTLVRGRLHVPSFHTDTAYVVVETARRSLRPGEEADGNEVETVWIPVTGFLGRNRAMHGDIVAAMPLWSAWRGDASAPAISSTTPPADAPPRPPAIPPAVPPSGIVGAPVDSAPTAQAQSGAFDDAASKSERSSPQERRQELKALLVELVQDSDQGGSHAETRSGVPLSVLGGHPDVRRLRHGLGPLRKLIEAEGEVFEVLAPDESEESVGKGNGVLVRLRPGHAPAPEQDSEDVEKAPAKGIVATVTSRQARGLTDSALADHKEELRALVLQRLRSTEEGALPLTALGQVPEVGKLKKAISSSGSLSRLLKNLDEKFEVVEEGSPPEAVVRLSGESEALVPPAAPPGMPPPPPAATAAPGAADSEKSLDTARCRVMAVLERKVAGQEVVAVLSSKDGVLRAQPLDRRLPAFWLQQDSQADETNSSQVISKATAAPKKVSKKEMREMRSADAMHAASAARARALSEQELLQTVQEQGKSGNVLCVMRFADWPVESLSPRACVMDILGPRGSMSVESDALLAFYGLEWRPFSSEVEASLKRKFESGDQVVADELAAGRRTDLRALRCVTIDPPQAKDLDDAVSVEAGRIPGTHRIGVHIADVTHFVQPGDEVDEPARKRATTVYLVGKVYPMLPRWLSEKLCSLLCDGDRLAFSVFYTMDAEGQLVEADPPAFCRSVIRTRGQLDYRTVDRVLEHGEETEGPVAVDMLTERGCQEPDSVFADLQALAKLTMARRKMRIEKGAVALQRSQLSFRLDESGSVTGLQQDDPSSLSHHLIEELMVLANHVVAMKLVDANKHLAEAGTASTEVKLEAAVAQPLLRRHPDTEGKVREKVFETLPPELRAQVPQELPLAGLLEWCSHRHSPAAYEALCAEVLTAFKEAEYIVAELEDNSAEDREGTGHWALSLPAYMHFTSPIRRYADVLVHRRLAYILEQELKEANVATKTATAEADRQAMEAVKWLEDLQEVVSTCNAKKRDAQDAQIDATQLALAEFVRRNKGVDVPDAVITRFVLSSTSRDSGDAAASGSGDNQEYKSSGKTFKQRLKERTFKDALEIYIPLAQCTRSVSLEALNLEIVEEPGTSDIETAAESRAAIATGGASSLRVRARGKTDEVVLKVLEPMPVRLVNLVAPEKGGDGSTSVTSASEGYDDKVNKYWTIRLPWSMESEAAPRSRPLSDKHPKAPPPPPASLRPPPPPFLPPHARA